MKVTAVTLSAFDIFRELSLTEREDIASLMKCHQYQSGRYIIPSAQDHNHVYFLISGQVKVCAYNNTGKQVYFENLSSGMMFGELAAIDNGDRTSDCICSETALVARLDKQSFLQVLEKYPSVKSRVLLRLVSMIRRQLQRVYEYTAYSVNQRIRFEILRLVSEAGSSQPPIVLENVPTQAELADRISSHREAVSRELKVLESDGLITWMPQAHVVHDPDALMRRAVAGK